MTGIFHKLPNRKYQINSDVKFVDFCTFKVEKSIFISFLTAADIYKLLLSVEGIKESDFGTQGLAPNVLTYLWCRHFSHFVMLILSKQLDTFEYTEDVQESKCNIKQILKNTLEH